MCRCIARRRAPRPHAEWPLGCFGMGMWILERRISGWRISRPGLYWACEAFSHETPSRSRSSACAPSRGVRPLLARRSWPSRRRGSGAAIEPEALRSDRVPVHPRQNGYRSAWLQVAQTLPCSGRGSWWGARRGARSGARSGAWSGSRWRRAGQRIGQSPAKPGSKASPHPQHVSARGSASCSARHTDPAPEPVASRSPVRPWACDPRSFA